MQAPAEVTVLRGELVREAEEENRRAAAPADAARALAAKLAGTPAGA